jgi:hypothetical protein
MLMVSQAECFSLLLIYETDADLDVVQHNELFSSQLGSRLMR